MPNEANVMIDPLGVFMTRIREGAGARPLPLVSTSFDVALAAGLATVTTTRRFRNDEAAPVEAIMTFPMPVHAALFALEARIDGRLLKASAQRREAARETYENAIQEGKAAVLHEEVLRGIHTLSVANLRPGGEVEVTLRWAATLAFVEGAGRLRIPLTVGQVYGSSGLNDSDELVADGRSGQRAQLAVRTAEGSVAVAGVTLADGRGEIPLDRPIDIIASAWSAASLAGLAADGRRVELTITPGSAGEAAASLAVLVDRSGSMGASFSSLRGALTNHEAAGAVIRGIGAALGEGDWLDLWEYSNAAWHVGQLFRFDGHMVEGLLGRRSRPGGGTETGGALRAVAGGSEARDILLITDGKSHALDVQALAKLGRRISVLLIGEDSLEARVGHLAALTGGELFIADPANLEAVASAMVAAIRTPYAPVAPIADAPAALLVRRGGVAIAARWTDAASPEAPAEGVGAMAAALALPALSEDRAAALAEAEGLITHLTSLVLVDHAGSIQEGIPVTRKIPLDAPRVDGLMGRRAAASAAAGAPPTAKIAAAAPAPASMDWAAAPVAPASRSADARFVRCPPYRGHESIAAWLNRLAGMIDWSADTTPLLAGDVPALPQALRWDIMALAGALQPEAESLGIAPVLLVIGLAARIAGANNRTAMRVARMLLDPVPAERLAALDQRLSRQPAQP
jgi:Vault protein inter-alpha-trypsin domain